MGKTVFKIGALMLKRGENTMPLDALMHDPMGYRYFDYPRVGSIYRLPDIPVVRGKTYVRLYNGKDIEVDPQFKRDRAVPADMHDHGKANASLEDLLRMLTGQRTAGPPPGFKAGGLFDKNTQNPLMHAHENPRRARHGANGDMFAF